MSEIFSVRFLTTFCLAALLYVLLLALFEKGEDTPVKQSILKQSTGSSSSALLIYQDSNLDKMVSTSEAA